MTNIRTARIKRRVLLVRGGGLLGIVLTCLIFLFPIIWILSVSVRSDQAVFTTALVVNEFHFENYLTAWETFGFSSLFLNSIWVTAVSIGINLIIASLAGYAFAKLKFKGSNVLFIIYLAQMMVPSQLTLIPRFVIFSQLGWMNTHMSLIVPKIIAVSSTFMLRQSFLGTPDELREAARIDGAGEYRAFAQVMLPLVKPAIAATATVQFLDAWNSYLDPLVFISNWKKWTIPLALNQFVGSEVTQYNLTMAACCLAVVPVFIVFLCGQRFFLKGLSVGAVKG